MSGILIEKSTISHTDVELDISVTSQMIIVNNNGIYDSLNDI